MRKFFLLNFSLLLLFNGAMAQDSLGLTLLREVVVSASRMEQPVIEIPRSVTVIDEEAIRNSIYQSLGDLLNAQSALYVVGANQTPGTNQSVFMRGSGSNQVAVLIDGVRITDPSSPNAAIDLSEISLANVERIEVIRGSHSTMFGGAAIGGVINLITKKNAPPGLHGDASWQGGNFGKDAWLSTENVNLSYGLQNGLYVTGSVFRQDVNGLDATPESEDRPGYSVDDDDFKKTDASIKAGYSDETWDVNLSFKNTHQYTEVDNGAFADDDNYYLIFDRKFLQYNAQYQLSPSIRFSVLGSFSDSERFYENDSSRVSDDTWDKAYASGSYYGKLQTHEAQFNFHRDAVKGVFGAGVYREKMFFENYFFYNDPDFPFESATNYDTLDTRTTTRYLFAQLGYGVGRFNLSAGARLSHHSMAGNFLTFEVNPSFAFSDLLLYFSLSTGYNPPSLYQLYDPSRSFTAHTTRGNSGLRPEQSTSVEAGIKKEFSSESFVTFSAFHTKVDRSIEYVFLWNGSTPVGDLSYADDRGDTYINVGRQRVYGLEAEGRVGITPKFSLQGNITLLNTKINVRPEDIGPAYTGGHHVQLYSLGAFLTENVEQEKLVRRPGFTGFAGLNYRPVSELTINTIYRYTGKRFDAGYDGSLGPYGALARLEVAGYHLVDAGVNWRVSENLSVACKVENMFDEKYREVVGFRTRGRSFYLKLTGRL